jgi:hypothetical protein
VSAESIQTPPRKLTETRSFMLSLEAEFIRESHLTWDVIPTRGPLVEQRCHRESTSTSLRTGVCRHLVATARTF